MSQSSSAEFSVSSTGAGAAPGGVAAVRGRVSAGEWRARVELAALYRLVGHFRWTDTIYTHISMRVPGEETFLINPFGYLYEEVTASSLVKLDGEGAVLDDPVGLGINKPGYVIHGAIHNARHDVQCVIHTHTRAGAGVSAQEEGLLPISQHAALFMGRIGYHDFEGIAVRTEEQERLVRNLGNHQVMILRNHGLLATGRSAGEAFVLLHMLERACEIQVAAVSNGARVRRISPESIEATHAVIDANSGFTRDWQAMLRLLDRIAPGYKD